MRRLMLFNRGNNNMDFYLKAVTKLNETKD